MELNSFICEKTCTLPEKHFLLMKLAKYYVTNIKAAANIGGTLIAKKLGINLTECRLFLNFCNTIKLNVWLGY